MILHKVLSQIFTTPSSVEVLRVLNERTVGITGRETARLANIAHRSALKVLTNLESLKIVRRNIGGRDHIFSINREHYLTKNIISKLFEYEKEFKSSLYSKIVKSLSGFARNVIVFGSVARKEEKTESDFDLCIVYDTGKRKIESIVSDLRDDIYKTYGITVAPFYITRREFIKKAKAKRSPVSEILNEGIVIYGKDINRLMNG